jgi:hypothetical protein
MRRVWIALTVFAVATALALPASAGRPDGPPGLDKPPVETVQYTVTMEFIGGSNGLATLAPCTDDGFLTMELSSQGNLGPVDAVPFLEVQIDSTLHWYRYYPYFRTPGLVVDGFDPNEYPLKAAETGDGLTDCHGGGVDVTIMREDGFKVLDDNPDREPITQAGNLFRLTPSDGAVGLLWHSDYYIEWENVSRNPKKTRYVGNDAEDFTYSGNFDWTNAILGGPVVWNPAVGASGIVSGNMRISYYRLNGYTPFEEGGEIGFPVEFVLTINPVVG